MLVLATVSKRPKAASHCSNSEEDCQKLGKRRALNHPAGTCHVFQGGRQVLRPGPKYSFRYFSTGGTANDDMAKRVPTEPQQK